MKKYLFSILFALVAVIPAMAQDVITGTVTESFGGVDEPCIGVNVVFVNAQNRNVVGTVTDLNGMYTLKVPKDANKLSIQFSYIGMKTQKFKYTGQTKLDVKLAADNAQTQLQEVKITGNRGGRSDMGVTMREQAFATQKISMSQIMETAPVASVEEALQGKLGGVDISTGGDPGAKANIRIRGTATINGNSDPLIVIDGVPYTSSVDDDFDFNTASNEDFATMLSINPNDIETVEVLKDAASTAVYGSKGANGVILITKKKGTRSKTRFTFSTKNYISVEPQSIPMLNGDQYTAYVQDALWNTANAKGLTSGDGRTLLEKLNTDEISYNPEFRYFDEYNQNTDWLSYVKKNAFTTDNSFSMSGGGDRANYRFSLGYMNQGGTTVGTGMTRLTTSFNVGYKFSDRLFVEAEYSYTDTDNDNPAISSSDIRAAALVKMPNKSPYYIKDGKMTDTYFIRQNSEEWQGAYKGTNNVSNSSYNFHPIIAANESYSEAVTKEQRMNVKARWYVIPEVLTYNGYVSMKFKTSKTDSWLPQSVTGLDYGLLQNLSDSRYQSIDQAGESYSNNFSLQTENKLMFTKTWNEMHKVTAVGLFRTALSRGSSWASYRAGVGSYQLADVSADAGYLYSTGSGSSETVTMSAIGSLVYTLLNRYTINGTLNYEGTSAITSDNRWGLFPSVGVSWQVQDEPFMKTLKDKFMTEWKLRVSYGTTGNAPSGTSPYVGAYSSIGSYMDDNATSISKMQLEKLKWETTHEINIGTDINLWDGKVNFSFDWYNKTTDDLLQKSYKLPYSTGYTSTMAWYNDGRLRNKGWETRIDYKVFKNKKWDVSVNFNMSHSVNTILELPANLSGDAPTLKNGSSYYVTKFQEGSSIGAFYGFRYLGVYQNTEDTYAKDADGNVMSDLDGNPIVMKNDSYTCYAGDAKYDDVNHDGVIDENDLVYLGNCNPTLTGGGGITAKYNLNDKSSLSLTVQLNYRLGQKCINAARMDAEGMYDGNNQSTAVLARWRNEGDITDIPRALWSGYGLNQMPSDRYVEDCSFLRFQSISIGYRPPKKFCNSIGLQSVNIFFTGYNLFTITNYKGVDPEVNQPSISKLSMDSSQTPVSRRYALGITVDF